MSLEVGVTSDYIQLSEGALLAERKQGMGCLTARLSYLTLV